MHNIEKKNENILQSVRLALHSLATSQHNVHASVQSATFRSSCISTQLQETLVVLQSLQLKDFGYNNILSCWNFGRNHSRCIEMPEVLSMNRIQLFIIISHWIWWEYLETEPKGPRSFIDWDFQRPYCALKIRLLKRMISVRKLSKIFNFGDQ